MHWLRLHHDTPNDPKWRLVAVESGQPVACVLAVWMHMLVNASASSVRGTLEGWNDRVIGATLDIRGDAVEAIRNAMQGVVLDGDSLTGWHKRQCASDNVAERVRRHRATKKPPPGDDGGGGESTQGRPNGAGGAHKGDVTLHGGDVTLQSPDVTLQAGNVTLPPLTREIQSKSKKEEDTRGCEDSPRAYAREVPTQVPPSEASAKVVHLPARTIPRPCDPGWMLPADWASWAVAQGHPRLEIAVRRFRNYWKARKERCAAMSPDQLRDHWETWVLEDLERERGDGGGHNGSKHDGLIDGLARAFGDCLDPGPIRGGGGRGDAANRNR